MHLGPGFRGVQVVGSLTVVSAEPFHPEPGTAGSGPSRLIAGARFLLRSVSHVAAVPVFFSYGAVLALLNPRRGTPVPAEISEVLRPWTADLEWPRVRIVAPALIPTGHLGVTIGHRIYLRSRPEPLDVRWRDLVLHELAHVRQVERMGLLGFAHGYGVEWARTLSYRDHPMEIEARNSAGHSARFTDAAPPTTDRG